MESITESQLVHKQWYEDAKKQTPETIGDFVKGLMENYNHDYGTICHAISAGAIGQAWAMNKHPKGGITGFQAGAVMWGFIREWNYSGNKTGLKIIDYDNFLFPQYEDKFEKTISKDIWENLQTEAKANIEKANKEYAEFLSKKQQYEIDLANYVKKFPDYLTNKKHYDRLGMGTSDEWDAERKKEDSGFEFAPKEPYEPITDGHRVVEHWKDVVKGKIPFGYSVVD